MDSKPLANKSFYTTHEAARLLSVTPRTVQLWCENNLIQCRKTSGGHRRIPRESIERLVASQDASAPADHAAADPAGRELRILVVDDEPALLRLYRMSMARWALKPVVTTVGNGFEALIAIGSQRPDLLIADLGLPDWDGFKMLHTIRGIADLDAMEIIAVSGLDRETIASRGGLPGDIRVFMKPVRFPVLEEVATEVARSLGRYAGPDQ